MSQTPSSLITLSDPRSPAAEAYRTLRTNIYFSSLDRSIHTLLVTSVAPHEDKSITVANLAVSLAQGDKKTILVDADVRRPTLHTLFGLNNDKGLTSLFIDAKGPIEPALQDVNVPNLQVLTSGPLPPNPAELLGSQRMLDVIEALKARADIVLFDAPPVIAVTDASVLGTRVDGVLLVVQAGQTRREQAKRAKQQLEKLNIRVVGAVLSARRWTADWVDIKEGAQHERSHSLRRQRHASASRSPTPALSSWCRWPTSRCCSTPSKISSRQASPRSALSSARNRRSGQSHRRRWSAIRRADHVHPAGRAARHRARHQDRAGLYRRRSVRAVPGRQLHSRRHRAAGQGFQRRQVECADHPVPDGLIPARWAWPCWTTTGA